MKTTRKIIAVIIVTASIGATLVQAKTFNVDPDDMKIHQKPRTEVMQFVKNNDYEGFKKWAEQKATTKLTEKVTPEKFSKMVELYNAVESKDFEKAKKLKEEIGFKGPGSMKKPFHKMMRQGMKEIHQQFSNLSAEVKAQLKAAFKAHDQEKVKQILEANGIKLPQIEKATTN